MSNNDKARQKLMESMRMTKADSGKKTEEVEAQKNVIPQEDTSAKKKEKNTVTKKAAKETQKTPSDPFQSARRVWPD